MEITKRFPQALGNLAGEREIPTFPQPIIFVLDEKSRRKNERYEVNHVSHTKFLTLPGQPPRAVSTGQPLDKLQREISERVRARLQFVGLAHVARGRATRVPQAQ